MKSILTVVTLVVCFGGFAERANAQLTDEWRFRAIVYGYFPTIGGSTSFPAGSSDRISVNADTIIDNLKFAFMGFAEARKGTMADSSMCCI